MFNLKETTSLKFIATFGLMVLLTACSSNSGDSIAFNPAVAPQNVQVVASDSNSGQVQNTISWTRDTTATDDYVVYVSNTPGVTDTSDVVIPAAKGYTYITHSGVDVSAGTTYYYRVQASAGGQASILSDEVSGTPQQTITSNALNDVAWNGTDTLIAVGDSGTIISSASGMADAWVDATNAVAYQSLSGVTWEGTNMQFLIVGAGGTVLTGEPNNWTLQNTPVTTDLEDVAWTGSQYIAVGKNGTVLITDTGNGSSWIENLGAAPTQFTLNAVASNGAQTVVAVGTAGTIITSADGGSTWTSISPVTNNHLNDITWDGNQFGVVGANDTILSSPDGETWTSHIPGTPNITFVAASQWDSSFPSPSNPVLGAVGSAGTFVVSPDSVTGFSVPTGTDQQLSGMTWVDNVTPPYFVMVGNDGTVMTSQLQ
jgi:photosystem II stability/assembly factor-like uncharacterized protein